MKKNSLALLAILPIALAGCASGGDNEASTDDSTMEAVAPVTSDSPQDSSEENERGNLVKKIGEEGSVTGEDDETIYSFKVTGIEPDIQCTEEYATAPENGHFVKIDLEVETAKAAVMDKEYYGNSVYMDGGAWKFISAEGTTYNGQMGSGPSFMCIDDSERLPANIGPAEKAAGSVILDVPNLEGTLVYTDPAVGGGWEYSIEK